MKYFALLAFVSLIPAAFAVERDPLVAREAVAREAGTRVTARDFEDFSKRACNYNTPCSCKGVPNGLFCGDGLLGCVHGHVYQCGENGKNSCDFGVRNSCQQCNKLTC